MPAHSPVEEELPLGFSDLFALAPARNHSNRAESLGHFQRLPKPLMPGDSVPSPPSATGPRCL